MNTEIILLLTAVCAATYSFEITFGLAGTILMLMVMHFFVDAKTLVIYSALPQIMTATVGLYRSPRVLDVRFLLSMLAFASIGALLGMYLFSRIPVPVFQTLLAVFVTASGVWLVLNPRTGKMPRVMGRLLDVLAGLAQMLVGISGPVAMTRLLATFDSKIVVRNLAFAFFLTLNLIRVGDYAISGALTPDIRIAMVVSAPVLLVTLWFSSRIHVHVNDAWFRKVVSWVILAGGLSLFLR